MDREKKTAPASETKGRQDANVTAGASERELLIREYEQRLARLKIGASPKDAILCQKTVGKVDAIGKAAAIMGKLSKHLWMDGKKFRVTIDCDPETGRFEIIRQELT